MEISTDTKFNNIYIYVSDALRYDYLPNEAEEQHLIKTVSASPVSCTAFPSLVTGLQPTQHGVFSFSGNFSSEIDTIFNLVEKNKYCYFGTAPIINSIKDIKQYTERPRFIQLLNNLEPPFAILDRELITHAPYSYEESHHISDQESQFPSTESYWKERGGQPQKIRSEFEAAADDSYQRFKRRIDILRERNLLEDTLVIFTADHGELLGEYGWYGHGRLLSPETTYVPTIFFNDSVTVQGNFMGQIDLFPTIVGLLESDCEIERLGYDLTEGAPDNRLLFNMKQFSDFTIYGAWDHQGGYTFLDGKRSTVLRWTLGQLSKVSTAPALRQQPLQAILNSLRRERIFGNPLHNYDEAQSYCESVLNLDEQTDTTQASLDEDVRNQLRSLGYVDTEIDSITHKK